MALLLQKKLLIVVIIVCLLTCGLFAQQKPVTNYELDRIQAFAATPAKDQSVKNPVLPTTGKNTTNIQFPASIASVLRQPNTPSCYDTAARFFIKNDTAAIYLWTPKQTADGHLLISGQYVSAITANSSQGFLLKCDLKGNVLWARKYDSAAHKAYHYINYYMPLELQDGTILLAGSTTGFYNGNDELILTRTTATGQIIWSKIYRSRLWTSGNGSADYYYVQQMKQDPATGDVYITGPFWAAGINVMRVNITNGNINWSKSYTAAPFSSDRSFGIDIRYNEIRAFSRSFEGGIITLRGIRINKNTGDTLGLRFFRVTDTPAVRLSFLGADGLKILNNGNYALSGSLFGNYEYQYNGLNPLYQAGVAEIDSNLNFVRAFCFRNRIENNPNLTYTTVFPDGSGIFTMTRTNIFPQNILYTQFRNGQITRRRIRRYPNEFTQYERDMLKLPTGEDMVVQTLVELSSGLLKIGFFRMSVTDTVSPCTGDNESQTFIQNYNIDAVPTYMPPILDSVFEESVNKTLFSQPLNLQWLPGCEQTSFCDSFSITANRDTLCPDLPLLIGVRKNRECGSLPVFTYPAQHVQSITPINDSVYQFIFKTAWQGYIYAETGGCTILRDSVYITVLQSPSTLNLGADTVICPNNTITLNARTGFLSYLWQNGSTDSTFIVTQPGTYFVRTVDACNRVFYDTIVVAPHPPIPFDIGPNRQICRGDTATLTAPAGFINYQWQPNYAISGTNSPTVNVFPQTDTTYLVQAEKTPGCFVRDSVRITVWPRPNIQLGNDTSICTGNSLVLNAGAGFAQYIWNNGATTPSITVQQPGTYLVTATTQNGCTVKDSLRLISLLPLPQPNLGNDTVLCAGTPRVLNPGTFSNYLWNTGSTAPAININQTGVYSVQVQNSNGCSGNDTLQINRLVQPPSGFLFGDTAICTYGTLTLTANSVFRSYLWSNNSTLPAITINTPGIYRLTVTDADNCAGTDTITVLPKQCLQGLFVPSAFTPNNDGVNDQFRPMLFGDVASYSFSIYNRWGTRVFYSTAVNEGWNGLVNGKRPDNQAFTWYCVYQLRNEPREIKKGTVLLIR